MSDKPSNFLATLIEDDLKSGKHDKIVTRFPPEPNGYLHIGHAKSICVNFGLAEQFGGVCNLRFDDTNPEKEEQEYIDSIKADIQWLGFDWVGKEKYTSDYFDQLYNWAVALIKQGDAYVCDLSGEEAREYRGTLTEPGRNSPYRERSVEENLDLFERMKNGEFDDGAKSLRAKIDMAAPNMNLRDPVLYRIRRKEHHQTGNTWCIYPSYDFAHGQSDALEGVTHSICTLEFEDHRPLYDWFIEKLPVPAVPHQYEFARLNVNYTVTSKRKLKRLVDEGVVDGWDDPRMPTISGMRRRGITPAALRHFADMVGTSRAGGVVDLGMLDHAIREDLNDNAPRAMAVLNPLKVVLTNLPDNHREVFTAPGHPNRSDLGERELPFTREIYIDRSDFNEDSSLSRKKFKRLVLGEWVRLRNAYIIQADEVIKDDSGEIVEIRATAVAGTVGADAPEGVRPRGVIHWVSASEGLPAEVRLYDRLFDHETPDRGGDDFMQYINAESLATLTGCVVEPSLAEAAQEAAFQFEREGYFVLDRYEGGSGKLVFNKTIGLKETWTRKV
ncbi:glutamine--tRNA ligase [Saccharospirillum sp. MSK14-1]|uniref:glutamine--tRNA ligase/YqeY domain fusion protein n=1 Tax=Saccharospirillum sp. MSK14-1 TaxID=1897632 RepID=UPI000D349E00|nr:glutamine--tRNA ligase/YqeY domain fusion protein [Saccharospirillum sp. MSK14-1]PTY36047.1 glutamine--tRNA ligase [Saccharospirillum sp. MSK14-1]